jgi:hypothetical protein
MRCALVFGGSLAAIAVSACDPCDETPVQIAHYSGGREPFVTLASFGDRAYVGWSPTPWREEDPQGTYIVDVASGAQLKISDVSSAVALGATERGLLVCMETYDETRCAIFDASLRIVRPAHVVDLEGIVGFTTFRGQLYAETRDGLLGLNAALIPIDADGTPTGAEGISLCGPSSANGPTRVGCAYDNYWEEEDRCRTFEGEPEPCEVKVSFRDEPGGPQVLGQGRWPLLTARGDEFLATWTGCDGHCTRAIHANGSLGATQSIATPGGWLWPREDGFIEAWSEDIGPNYELTGPTYVQRLDREGAPVGDVVQMAPTGPWYGSTYVVPTVGGFTAAWTSTDALSWIWNIQARAICND